jgi:rubrerythrin
MSVYSTINEHYQAVHNTRIFSIFSFGFKTKSQKALELVHVAQENLIRNYIDLVVLDLNMNVVPQNVQFYETYNSFSNEIGRYLEAKRIHHQYIYDDNRHLTKEFAQTLPRFDTETSSVKIVIACRECGKGLRVPQGKHINVSCPHCRKSFVYDGR